MQLVGVANFNAKSSMSFGLVFFIMSNVTVEVKSEVNFAIGEDLFRIFILYGTVSYVCQNFCTTNNLICCGN